MPEFILHVQLFHLIAEGYDLWSGMLLYECIPFIWRDIPKPIQRWQTPLHIVLVETMSEPPKCVRYCFRRSIFANFFLLKRENIMFFDESS
jgi:hypothetical protein